MILRRLPLNFDPYLVPIQCVWEENNDERKEGYSREVSCGLEATFMNKDLPPIYKDFKREYPIFGPPFYQTMDHLLTYPFHK